MNTLDPSSKLADDLVVKKLAGMKLTAAEEKIIAAFRGEPQAAFAATGNLNNSPLRGRK